MSDNNEARPKIRPFLASHDLRPEQRDGDGPVNGGDNDAVNAGDDAAKAEQVEKTPVDDRGGAFLPAHVLKNEGGVVEGEEKKVEEEASEVKAEVEEEASPVRVVGREGGGAVEAGEENKVSKEVESGSRLSEKIEQATVEEVAAPMAHYARKERVRSAELSASDVIASGRRSGSTRRARVGAIVGGLGTVAIAVAVYVTNQGIYTLNSPSGGVTESDTTQTAQQSNQSDQSSPATLAAIAGTRTLSLSANGFETLDEGHYQLWLDQGGQVQSIGLFAISENGSVVDDEGEAFTPEVVLSDKPAKLFVTIEAGSEVKDRPSATVIATGDISGEEVRLSFGAVDLSTAAGVYVIGAPTDLSGDHQASGLWLATTDGQRLTGPGLSLPKAPTGWVYEGQMIYKGEVIAMGRFSAVEGRDDFRRFTPNPDRTPNYPGEDYLQGAPSRLGLDFPADLTTGEWKVLITLEPDNNGVDPSGDAGFFIHVLEAEIARDSQTFEEYALQKPNRSLPTMQVVLK